MTARAEPQRLDRTARERRHEASIGADLGEPRRARLSHELAHGGVHAVGADDDVGHLT